MSETCGVLKHDQVEDLWIDYGSDAVYVKYFEDRVRREFVIVPIIDVDSGGPRLLIKECDTRGLGAGGT